MKDLLSLKVNGKAYEGWKTVTVDRSLDTLAGGLQLGFTDRWPNHPDKWAIEAGDGAEVWIASDKVCTSWIDVQEIASDAETHSIEVTGRDKTADLADCSVVHGSGSFSSRSIVQIVSELAKPFGISVVSIDGADGTVGAVSTQNGKAGREPFRRMALQQGETGWELIDRLARQRAVMAITNADGVVEIRQPGRTKAGYTLERGRNVKRARFRNDMKDRYSDYILKGQPQGGEFLLDQPAYTPKATAKDPGVTRYRPLIIVNEDESTGASLTTRAKWEATIRAGRARRYVCAVDGWHAYTGELYTIDRLVPVKDVLLGVDAQLLVSAVKFIKTDKVTETELTLVPPEAYSLIDLPARKSKKKGGGVDPLIGLQ